jgi:2-oxoglutarate dehydrogenase E1 component
MRVTFPSNAAQYFHLLRNQAKRERKNPLIVLTPKSLLRADVAKCGKSDILDGHFRVILEDPEPPADPAKIIFCTGKVVYDLLEYRKREGITDALIVRIEQLYPFPFDQIGAVLKKYSKTKDIRWVQEEPRNMGAWTFILPRMQEVLSARYSLNFVGRLPSASPAAGVYQLHLAEQELIMRQAFA